MLHACKLPELQLPMLCEMQATQRPPAAGVWEECPGLLMFLISNER